MRVLIATDAWKPQVNGVVRTYERLQHELTGLGVETVFLTPDDYRTIPCPTYPEIRLAVPGFARTSARMAQLAPDAIHIATEGPVGLMARRWCLARGIPFTTSFHTRFAEYLNFRFKIPAAWIYSLQRRFHNAGAGMMVASPILSAELVSRGFQRPLPWSRGVDTDLFRPRDVRLFGADEPVFLYVGRVAVEKNICGFLDLDLPGKKVVVGAGPMLQLLRARYPNVLFTGKKIGEELAACYASADVFVFPSLTDTFGIVLLEAMASGVPVAAFPVAGPSDTVVDGVTGVLGSDLRAACLAALKLDRSRIAKHAAAYGWENTARLFMANIESALFAAHGRRMPAAAASLSTQRRPTGA
jgi:glycosyltransferase involved in cell wall biosynthesis